MCRVASFRCAVFVCFLCSCAASEILLTTQHIGSVFSALDVTFRRMIKGRCRQTVGGARRSSWVRIFVIWHMRRMIKIRCYGACNGERCSELPSTFYLHSLDGTFIGICQNMFTINNIVSTRTRHYTSRRVGLHKPTQKWWSWSLQDDTHLTQVHGTEKAANRQPLRTATTDSWTSAAQVPSHTVYWQLDTASACSWKMKKPLTGYRAGARHVRKVKASLRMTLAYVAASPYGLLSFLPQLSCFMRIPRFQQRCRKIGLR